LPRLELPAPVRSSFIIPWQNANLVFQTLLWLS
jgi:hypothetical protein